MIEVRDLVKRFGGATAVDHLSFVARPGRVTGFLGPNGSGKSTTMRCILGLDRSQAGNCLVGGRPYVELEEPLREVGALLDAGYVHPARSARNHLRWVAAANGLDDSRVDEVLATVGLSDVAKRKVKGYSLGMRQRLGLASVLLGDPGVIMLDEPANGLDPEGIRWIRDVLVHLARDGRTVLVSSHLLSEMALMADDLIVIARGQLVEQGTVEEFVDRYSDTWVKVRTPQPSDLENALRPSGAGVHRQAIDELLISGVSIERVGEAAAHAGVVLHELSPQTQSLEDAFLRATAHLSDYHAVGTGAPGAQAAVAVAPDGPPPPGGGWAPPASPSGGGPS